MHEVRLGNTDARKGKSGGYRVIYYIVTDQKVTLLTIYFKGDAADIPKARLEAIINECLG